MPLNKKGKKIRAAMEREYGSEKGKRVFYASENSGRVKGVTKAPTHERARAAAGGKRG